MVMGLGQLVGRRKKAKAAAINIFRAAEAGDVSLIKAYSEAGGGMAVKHKDGFTPLHLAVMMGHTAAAKLLSELGSEINATDKAERLTALAWAAQLGHAEIVEHLLGAGANSETHDMDELTPLHWACRLGHKECVELLVNGGANLNEADYDGKTPLHWVIAGQGKDKATKRIILQLLLEKGALPHLGDKECQTPLHLAARAGHERMVLLLLKYGASANAVDYWGYTPILGASSNGQGHIIQILLASDKSLADTSNNFGASPLHRACAKGHLKVTTQLIDQGASLEEPDANGCTPLHTACRWSHTRIVELLLSRGANPLAKAKDRRTPLQVCIRKAPRDLMEVAEAKARDLVVSQKHVVSAALRRKGSLVPPTIPEGEEGAGLGARRLSQCVSVRDLNNDLTCDTKVSGSDTSTSPRRSSPLSKIFSSQSGEEPETEAAPAETETAPAQTETAPAQTETAPAAAKTETAAAPLSRHDSIRGARASLVVGPAAMIGMLGLDDSDLFDVPLGEEDEAEEEVAIVEDVELVIGTKEQGSKLTEVAEPNKPDKPGQDVSSSGCASVGG
ncbi:unnamed protein product [Chrysoparadoxa australica]